MKKIILTISIVAALTMTACKSQQEALDARRATISWAAFCAARGYALDDNTYQATNEYLDTWCGSVEEEAAFIAAGVQPY
ncbi:MAG: hypothetical protein K2L28_00325 [Muribaculaceae bacterium]|nr:hypothetical protein [Muribaculaceae bacterium]